MTESEKFAKKLKRCLGSAPEGIGIYCMDGDMLVISRQDQLVINETGMSFWDWAHEGDLAENQQLMADAGAINDCGGW